MNTKYNKLEFQFYLALYDNKMEDFLAMNSVSNPLFLASDKETVNFLVEEYNADINECVNGFYPIEASKNIEVFNAILDYGFDFEKVNKLQFVENIYKAAPEVIFSAIDKGLMDSDVKFNVFFDSEVSISDKVKFLNYGFNINEENNHILKTKKNLTNKSSMIKDLVSIGLDFNKKIDGRTILEEYLHNSDLMPIFLQKGFNPNTLIEHDDDVIIPYFFAHANNKDLDILLKNSLYPVDFSLKHSDGYCFWECFGSKDGEDGLFIKKIPSKYINITNKNNETVLYSWRNTASMPPELIEIFVNKGGDITLLNNNNEFYTQIDPNNYKTLFKLLSYKKLDIKRQMIINGKKNSLENAMLETKSESFKLIIDLLNRELINDEKKIITKELDLISSDSLLRKRI